MARSQSTKRASSAKKSRKAQTASSVDALREPQAFLEEHDTPFEWMYAPHTISGLVAVAGFVLYFGFVAEENYDSADLKFHQGIWVAAVVFLVYCGVQLRDSILVRPHPAIWRVVHGAGILYLLFLVFLLMQGREAARRQLLPVLLNVPYKKSSDSLKEYGMNCKLYDDGNPSDPWHNLRSTFVDEFTVAHALGWVGKAIMLRDWYLLHALNISWELIEYTLQPKLKNFFECWWDHWILDAIICNLGGAWIGMQIVHYLEMHPYDWTGSAKVSTRSTTSKDKDVVEDAPNSSMLASVASQLGPYNFVRYEWRIFSGMRQLLSVTLLLIMIEGIELCAFTLKHVLYIPNTHPFNISRLVLWWMLALPALNEWYVYATDPGTRRLGQNLWLALAILTAEVLVSLKFGDNLHLHTDDPDTNIQPFVLYTWPAFVLIGTSWALLRFYGHRVIRSKQTRSILGVVLIVLGAATLLTIIISQDVYLGRNFPCSEGGTNCQHMWPKNY